MGSLQNNVQWATMAVLNTGVILVWLLSEVCSNLTHSEVNELNGQGAQKRAMERSEP